MGTIFGNKLCSMRKSCGLSQKELADALQKRGIKVTNQAVSKWESGSSLPSAQQFLILCDIIGINDIGGVFLGKSNQLFAGINDEGRIKIAEYAGFIRDSGLYDAPDAPTPRGSNIRVLPVYDLETANGTGQLLDLPDYTPMNVGTEVPIIANFGIRITGDSMEPDYHDGEIVWIQRRAKLEHGEIGVFIYEGNCYFKRLRDRVGGTRLQCTDSNYPDVIISNPENLISLGQAVS